MRDLPDEGPVHYSSEKGGISLKWGTWEMEICDVLNYAKEALEMTPANKPLTPSSWTVGPSNADLAQLVAKNDAAVRKQVDFFQQNMELMKADLEAKMKELEKECIVDGGNLPSLVQSLGGKVVHLNVSMVASSPPVTWRTKCGWFYGKSNFCFVQGGLEVTCLKCKAAQSTEDETLQL